MRTSRIARETAHVLDALSNESRRSTRRTLHVQTSDLNGIGNNLPLSDATLGDSDTATSSSLGKRKRETNGTPKKAAIVDATTVRRSPRKAQSDANLEARPRKPPRQPAKRIKGSDGDFTVEAPPNWGTVYNATAVMRKRVLAPVDTMGCVGTPSSRAYRYRLMTGST